MCFGRIRHQLGAALLILCGWVIFGRWLSDPVTCVGIGTQQTPMRKPRTAGSIARETQVHPADVLAELPCERQM